MQAYHLRAILFLKMAHHRIAHHHLKLLLGVGFSKNGLAKGARDEPALWCIFYHEDDLAHASTVAFALWSVKRSPYSVAGMLSFGPAISCARGWACEYTSISRFIST